MESIVIVGFGGHAKSVADTIERENKYRIIGYTDLQKHDTSYNYLGTDDALKALYESGVHNAVVGIGYMGKGDLRARIYKSLKEIGFNLPVIVDPSAIIADSSVIEEGTFVGKGVIVNADAYVGKMVILNTKSLVEHECVVKDYSHIAVGAVLCGQVEIGESVLVGANATVIQCRRVADNRIVPAGYVYRKDDLKEI